MSRCLVLKYTFLVLICVFLLAYIAYKPNRYVNRAVNKEELVGKWVVTDNSLKLLKEVGYTKWLDKSDHEINFIDVQNCSVKTFDYTHHNPTEQEQDKEYLNCKSAAWNIVKIDKPFKLNGEKVQFVDISYEKKTMIDGKSGIFNGRLGFFINEKSNKLILWNYLSDPDYCRFMEFVKDE